MWVFCRNEKNGLFEIGYFKPDGDWQYELTATTGDEAMRCVNFLNGGTGLPVPLASNTRT